MADFKIWAWQLELKSFYCLKINQISRHKTWWRTGKKICLCLDTELYLSYCRVCSSAACILSRNALCFCLLTIWAESFDYIPGEKLQFGAVLELFRCPTTRGRAWFSFWAEWRRLLPSASLTWTRKALLQVPFLKWCCTQLTGCQHSQSNMQDLSQSRNMCEGGRKMQQCCNPGKSQSTAHLFCLTRALVYSGLWRLQSALPWLQREFLFAFWHGSRQDERD